MSNEKICEISNFVHNFIESLQEQLKERKTEHVIHIRSRTVPTAEKQFVKLWEHLRRRFQRAKIGDSLKFDEQLDLVNSWVISKTTGE